MRFAHYDTGEFFDEMFGERTHPRVTARALIQFIDALPDGELLRRQRSAERALLNLGITFNVYGDGAGTERIFLFDLVQLVGCRRDRDGRGELAKTAQARNLGTRTPSVDARLTYRRYPPGEESGSRKPNGSPHDGHSDGPARSRRRRIYFATTPSC